MVEMIGQALSAITLGFTARNGEKIAISELPRRRLNGRRVVKEQVYGVKRSFFLLLQGSRTALRTRTGQLLSVANIVGGRPPVGTSLVRMLTSGIVQFIGACGNRCQRKRPCLGRFQCQKDCR